MADLLLTIVRMMNQGLLGARVHEVLHKSCCYVASPDYRMVWKPCTTMTGSVKQVPTGGFIWTKTHFSPSSTMP